jgi:hypothetical protein
MAKAKEKAKEPKKEDDFGDNIRLGDLAKKLMQISGGIGVVGIGVSLGLGFTGDRKEFLHAYLVAFAFMLSVGLGALWWVTLQHLVNAKWSIVVRRVGELLANNMPMLVLLSLPIVIPTLMGDTTLYIWADAHKMHETHDLARKASYLNGGFFVVRLAIYFGFWWLLSRYFLKASVEQDKSGAVKLREQMASVSAPSMIAIALTLTFASFDFLMSLEPNWGSTIFGVYYFAGSVVSFHAFFILSLMWLQKQGRLAKSVTVEHYHDLGKMMFAFTAFWAYIAFSQFMLIWYGNMPEETQWFHFRNHGAWHGLSFFMIASNFLIPFFGLLSRHVKRSRPALAFWALWTLVVHWLDMFWLVKPHLHTDTIPVGLLDVTCMVGVIGLFIASAAWSAQKINLVPVKDPRLQRSLAFENF